MLREFRYFIPLLFAVTGIISCTLFTNEKEEPSPQIPGKLVFSAPDDNGRYQIYTSLTNGTNRKQLTSFENNSAFEPSWSPDGEQIVFISNLNGSSHEFPIYLMNEDGSNLRPIHQPAGTQRFTAGNNPRWSPDGTKIAFEQCVNCSAGGNFDIYVYDFQKDSVEQITFSNGNDRLPIWNMFTEKIIFVSDRDYINADTLRLRKDLYKMDSFQNEAMLQKLTNEGQVLRAIANQSNTKILFNDRSNQLNELNLSNNNLKSFNVNLPDSEGFRPIGASTDSEIIFILTFSLITSRVGESIQIYSVLNDTLSLAIHDLGLPED